MLNAAAYTQTKEWEQTSYIYIYVYALYFLLAKNASPVHLKDTVLPPLYPLG